MLETFSLNLYHTDNDQIEVEIGEGNVSLLHDSIDVVSNKIDALENIKDAYDSNDYGFEFSLIIIHVVAF